MKITYPECQIEISVDEVIELNNYYEEQKTVITGRPPELHGLNPVDFDKFRLNVKDKEWMEKTLKDSLGKLHKQLLDSTDPNRHGDGIEHLIHDDSTKETDVILLDDAFQHRYVKPGVNILLVDYHRSIIYDKLMPAGRLREPLKGKDRADIVIVTKCPKDLKPMDFRVLTKQMDLYPYQQLFFTTLEYGQM